MDFGAGFNLIAGMRSTKVISSEKKEIAPNPTNNTPAVLRQYLDNTTIGPVQ
jgi:hypothetical protein